MKRVAIVGMGASRNDFVHGSLVAETAAILDDAEVWAINSMAVVIKCDKMFAMDPLDDPAVIDTPDGYTSKQLKKLRDSKQSIISSRKFDGYNVEEYPLKEVTEFFNGFQYFNSTPAYAVALAIYRGYDEIMLFGIDYSYPDQHKAESGRACVEFWLGIAISRGIKVIIANSSSLMDQNTKRKLYGYPEAAGDATT